MMKRELSRRLKKKALDLGADVAGVAGNEGFDQAPEGHRPEDILKGARCVISLGFAQPSTVIQKAMPTQYTRNIFTVASLADQVAHLLTLWIEAQGYEAIPISARGMYMAAMTGALMGDLSHKHTAALAGLGEIGVNTLLIHPEFGNRLALSSIVTNAPLHQDKPFSKKLCLGEKCLKCVEVCPVKAISPSGKIEKVKCAKYYRSHEEIYKETWGLYFCRECRRVCPIGLSQNIKERYKK
jgi:epoxyqueuosine reductase QueG